MTGISTYQFWLLLGFVMLFSVACEKTELPEPKVCHTPVWLLSMIEDETSWTTKSEIYLMHHNGECIYEVNACVMCPDAGVSVYDYHGNMMCHDGGMDGGSCEDLDIDYSQRTLVWQNY